MFIQNLKNKENSFISGCIRHYSYDIHGNVKTLWQDNKPLAEVLEAQRFKRIDYDYDLVSGNVNNIYYQKDSIDAFAHHYEYDADNWEQQAVTERSRQAVAERSQQAVAERLPAGQAGSRSNSLATI